MTRTWSRPRRAVAARGFTPASWIPAASEGRAEEATIREARVIEDLPVRGRAVGAAEPWPGPVAFLDGIQQYEVMAYAGASPLVVAEVAAAVMERRDRQLRVASVTRRRLVLARPTVLADLGDSLTEHVAIELPETGPRIRCATSSSRAGRLTWPAAASRSRSDRSFAASRTPG